MFFAGLLVTIPSYMYYLDGYFGVGEGHCRIPAPGTHKGDPRIQCTCAGHGLEVLFFISAVVSGFWFLAGNRFWCYLLTYLEYNTVVALR